MSNRARTILANSGLPIVPANDLGDAAKKIVAEVKKARVRSGLETTSRKTWLGPKAWPRLTLT